MQGFVTKLEIVTKPEIVTFEIQILCWILAPLSHSLARLPTARKLV